MHNRSRMGIVGVLLVAALCAAPVFHVLGNSADHGPEQYAWGRTDWDGEFTLTLGPGVSVTSFLTECKNRPIRNAEFSIGLWPRGDTFTIEDLGGFTFSMPGYEDITITEFAVHRDGDEALTYDVGIVSLRRLPPEPISGTTDGEGKFEVTLASGVGVIGELMDARTPLPYQDFTLTPIQCGVPICFTFCVPGYVEVMVTEFSVYRTGPDDPVEYDVGTVSVFHSGARVMPFTGRTDAAGRFFAELNQPFAFSVEGQLLGPDGEPLEDHEVTVTLEPSFDRPEIRWFGDVSMISLSVPGYGRAQITAQAGDLGFIGTRPVASIGPPVHLSVQRDPYCVGSISLRRIADECQYRSVYAIWYSVEKFVETCGHARWHDCHMRTDRVYYRDAADDLPDVDEEGTSIAVITEEAAEEGTFVVYTFYISDGHSWIRLGQARVLRLRAFPTDPRMGEYVEVGGHTYRYDESGRRGSSITLKPTPEPEEEELIIIINGPG